VHIIRSIIIVVINPSPVWLNASVGRTVSIRISYIDNADNLVSDTGTSEKIELSALPMFDKITAEEAAAIDTLRSQDSWSFAMSSLGSWIIYHVVNKYRGKVEMYRKPVSGDANKVTTVIEFEYPYAVGSSSARIVVDDLSPPHRQELASVDSRDKDEKRHQGHRASSTDTISINDKAPDAVDSCEPQDPTPRNLKSPGIDAATAAPPPTTAAALATAAADSLRLGAVCSTTSGDGDIITVCSTKIRHYNVLVVDDVLSNRKILSRLLTRLGYTCSMACNGAEAIDKFRAVLLTSASIDVVCMDYEVCSSIVLYCVGELLWCVVIFIMCRNISYKFYIL
jgi:hypothetical protein